MKKISIISSVFLALFICFSFYSLYPKITYTLDYESKPGHIYITDRFGEVITDKQNKNGYYKHIITDLDSEFVHALLKIEDKNYYSHFGVDMFSKIRALYQNILAGEIVSGGSTITEQYVKNKFFLGKKRTVLQKLREAYLALVYNFEYDKDLILQLYYHNVYFGNQLYGIGAAMEVYFGKDDIHDLTQEEITLLISLIHNPGIQSLEEKNFREYFERVKTRLAYDFERTIFQLNKKENIDRFPFVTQRVLESNSSLEINIKSTIDSELQEFARKMLNETLDDLKGKNVTNGAFIVYNPRSMEVLAYQGSRNFDALTTDGEVDVIQSKRQLGSTLKPFLYLQALKSGANIDDFIVDMENEYNSFQDGKVYISENYSLKEYGLVRFKKAIGNSMNNAAVRLAKELGLEEVLQFFKEYGLDLEYNAEHYGYSLVLGNPSISLENLVLSYRNLIPNYKVNNNYKLYFVYDEEDGKAIQNYSTTDTDADKFLLYDILKNPDNRDISFGVNSILNTSIYQAVKTGTSSEFRDNVVVSYHPDLIVGVWIGNNDNTSMTGVTGITGAGYLWHQIIEKSIDLGIITDYEYDIPEGIEKGAYCLDSDCLRQEIIYKKSGKDYKSAIIDNSYYESDIFEKISSFERKKLDDFGFNVIQ